MNLVNTFDRFEEQTARLEKVIFIAGSMGDMDAINDDLEYFLETVSGPTLAGLFGDLPSSVAEAVDDEDTGALCAWLRQQCNLGFLVSFAAPIMTGTGTAMNYSWGHYRTNWFYADTFEAALEKGFAWVAEQRPAGGEE